MKGGHYGGSLGTEKSYHALIERYTVVDYFVGKKPNSLRTFMKSIFLFAGGLSPGDLRKITALIKEKSIDIVFLDTSLFGKAARTIKKCFPYVKIIVNFHNHETRHTFDLIRQGKLIYFPLWLAVMYNEKLSLKHSDLNIFITKDDQDSIGRTRAPSIIIPVTLPDQYSGVQKTTISTKDTYVLFVGAAAGHTNIQGIDFLIKNIAPHITLSIVIAGKGTAALYNKTNIPQNVHILDYVEDLSLLYEEAAACIIPVFCGMGMKVKVAEAMMYGKKILATTRAFAGYELNAASCVVCNGAGEFIDAVNKLDTNKKYYRESRELYLAYYSSQRNEAYYAQIDGHIQ